MQELNHNTKGESEIEVASWPSLRHHVITTRSGRGKWWGAERCNFEAGACERLQLGLIWCEKEV